LALAASDDQDLYDVKVGMPDMLRRAAIDALTERHVLSWPPQDSARPAEYPPGQRYGVLTGSINGVFTGFCSPPRGFRRGRWRRP
jgi:hypothetical protein